jgi:CheY-like chemotaxis protein
MNTSKEEMADQSILLVDDDPGILKAISWILADEGYKVASTLDSHQALETLDRIEKRLADPDPLYEQGVILGKSAKGRSAEPAVQLGMRFPK